jgi:hypothetical protein
MGISVLVALRIGRESILVAVLVRFVVLNAIFSEPVLTRMQVAVDLLLVDLGNLGVGNFAGAASAAGSLWMSFICCMMADWVLGPWSEAGDDG